MLLQCATLLYVSTFIHTVFTGGSTPRTTTAGYTTTGSTTTTEADDFCQEACELRPDYCRNGATCVGTCVEGTIFRQLTCQCSLEYTGTRCETSLVKTNASAISQTNVTTTPNPFPCGDLCAKTRYRNFCHNGGTCVTECHLFGRKLVCLCPAQYTGTVCETALFPPTNVTTAISQTGMAATTPSPFPCGDLCSETRFQNFCENGGKCVTECDAHGGQAVCQCPDTYGGNQCKTPVSEPFDTAGSDGGGVGVIRDPYCVYIQSQCPHGTVSCWKNDEGTTSARCDCENGWIGEVCNIPCTLECGDYGTCYSPGVMGPQKCSCDTCYAGDRCETLLTLQRFGCPCTLDCSQHGSCYIDDSDTMRCDCWGNYTGENCETFVEKLSEEDYWGIVGGCVALLVVLAVLIVVVPYCMYKKRIEIALRVAYFFRKFEDDDDNDYDAFVSYSSNEIDERFVVQQLYPILELQHNFKLCLHFRDFQPGELIIDNILNNLTRSRRTILVLSPRYLESAYCRMEYELAHEEMLKLKNKIIPIMLEDVEGHPMAADKHLKRILNTVTYEKWPRDGNPKKEEKFWNKIVLSMPKKRQQKQAPAGAMAADNNVFVLEEKMEHVPQNELDFVNHNNIELNAWNGHVNRI